MNNYEKVKKMKKEQIFSRVMKVSIIMAFCLGCSLLPSCNKSGAEEVTDTPWFSAELENVPVRTMPTDANMPKAATLPLLRHVHRLHFLGIFNQTDRTTSFQRISRRCNASLDMAFLPGGNLDKIYTLAHTNDRWIEASKNPSPEDVATEAKRLLSETLKTAADKYDVIFSNLLLPELAEFARQGGIWVVTGNIMPDEDDELFKLWPAAPTGGSSWHGSGATPTDAAEVAGLPLEHLGGHQWHKHYEVLDGARALATGGAGAAFVRQVGKGAILLVPTGAISKKADAIASKQDKYDHDEIWLRFWDQVLHELVEGKEALPVVADLKAPEEYAKPGDYVLSGTLLNRSDEERQVNVAVHVVDPSGKIVHLGETLSAVLAPNIRQTWDVVIPVAGHWQAGLYAVYLTVGDQAVQKQLHQALELLPVSGSMNLKVVSDKPGYRIGESAAFTIDASSLDEWQGELHWTVHDFRGRTLGAGILPAELKEEKSITIPFKWTFADHGVRVDTVWATVTAVKDGKTWARAYCKVYKHERWDMRNEYQWSTWSNMACAQPSVAPRNMQLMAHMGFNALGYPMGGREMFYPAERWSWRMYNEGVGVNTFSPVIEGVTDEEIEAIQRRRIRSSADLKSGSLVLASYGEEAGFNSGWGRTYYWNEPVAPENACRAFQRFLKECYPTLEALNGAWGTAYRQWEEIKLTKEFSGRSPTIDADGWAHPKESPLGDGDVQGVSLAPYGDTRNFYRWYYDKIIGIALKILHEEINPVPLAFASAPSSEIFASKQHASARTGGASSWRDIQYATQQSTAEGPAFGMAWGHFDWSIATENILWGSLMSRIGHHNYWVDVPLHFNPDMTATRSTWAIRRWRQRTAHVERLLLDAEPVKTEVAVLDPSGMFLPQTPEEMTASVRIALNQEGFGYNHAKLDDLSQNKLVFSLFRQQMSQAEAEALSEYVRNGGTLVFGQRFATQNSYGLPQQTLPGFGLAEEWGLRVTDRLDPMPQRINGMDIVSADLAVLDPDFSGLYLQSFRQWNEKVDYQPEWTMLAAYPDETPALLTRTLGKGRLVYLNAAYRAHRYIQWVTPTGEARQGFHKLIEKLCLDAGVQRAFRIDGEPEQKLHIAALSWKDPSGAIDYVVTRTQGQTIWSNGELTWLGKQDICYDVLAGKADEPAPVHGRKIPLQLRPGAGRLLAFTSAPVKKVKLSFDNKKLTSGQKLSVTVDILDPTGKPVPGKFPVMLRVLGPEGEIPALRRDLSLASGETVAIATALNDPSGTWTMQVREGISRLMGAGTVEVQTSPMATNAPDFQPWGWPSENWEDDRMPTTEFIERLEKLSAVYRTETPRDWRAKQWLGAHYCFFPGTRHELTRSLMDVDWTDYSDALGKAVADGANFILVGQDLGIDPGGGGCVWPHVDARQCEAVANAMLDARWDVISGDGEVLRASLGAGSLVLSRKTPDGAGSSWGAAHGWQLDLLQTLRQNSVADLKAPDADLLKGWLAGDTSLLDNPSTIIWKGGWEEESNRTPVWRDKWTSTIIPGKPGPVFELRLPPHGRVQEVELQLDFTGDKTVVVDVGAAGKNSVKLQPGEKSLVLSGDEFNAYLDWKDQMYGGIESDLDCWRILPIRFTSAGETEIRITRAETSMVP